MITIEITNIPFPKPISSLYRRNRRMSIWGFVIRKGSGRSSRVHKGSHITIHITTMFVPYQNSVVRGGLFFSRIAGWTALRFPASITNFLTKMTMRSPRRSPHASMTMRSKTHRNILQHGGGWLCEARLLVMLVADVDMTMRSKALCNVGMVDRLYDYAKQDSSQ